MVGGSLRVTCVASSVGRHLVFISFDFAVFRSREKHRQPRSRLVTFKAVSVVSHGVPTTAQAPTFKHILFFNLFPKHILLPEHLVTRFVAYVIRATTSSFRVGLKL